jgi:hypothetical protein
LGFRALLSRLLKSPCTSNWEMMKARNPGWHFCTWEALGETFGHSHFLWWFLKVFHAPTGGSKP